MLGSSWIGSPLALFPGVTVAAAVLWWRRLKDDAVLVAAAAAGGPALDQVLRLTDRTGLDGKFDVDVEFVRAPKNGQAPAADADASEPGMAFAEAFKRQAGLRLVRQVGPIEVLVVDHVERPTEN